MPFIIQYSIKTQTVYKRAPGCLLKIILKVSTVNERALVCSYQSLFDVSTVIGRMTACEQEPGQKEMLIFWPLEALLHRHQVDRARSTI